MNILFFSNTGPPFVGGVERSLRSFAEEFRRLGHRVIMVIPEFKNAEKKEDDIIRVPAIQKFNGSDFSVPLPIPVALAKHLDDFVPHVIHSHHPFLLGDTALRIAAKHKIPVFFTHHTFYEQYTHYVPGDSPVFKRFIVALSTGYANLCDCVIAPSVSVKEEIQRRGVEVPSRSYSNRNQPRSLPQCTGCAFQERSGGTARRLRHRFSRQGRSREEHALYRLCGSVLHGKRAACPFFSRRRWSDHRSNPFRFCQVRRYGPVSSFWYLARAALDGRLRFFRRVRVRFAE